MARFRSQVSALLLILEVFSTTELIDAQNAPLNVAANVGARVVINCTTGDSVFPGWRYSQTGTGSFTPISFSGSCNSLVPTRFVVETTGNGNCNLIIPSATTAEALAYQCDDGRAFNHFMLLTIIESIEVSPNSAAQELCPGDPLNITCSVEYSAISTPGYQMFPSIMWTNLSANANLSGTDVTPSNVTTSYLSIVVNPPIVPPYSCNVYFNVPSLPTGFATNAPSYYKSTNTAQLQVEYLSERGSITSNITERCVNGTALLTCEVDGYPVPSYEWRNADTNAIISNTNETVINSGGNYECIAYSSACNSTTRKFSCANDPTCATCSGVSGLVISYDGTEVYEPLHCSGCSEVLLTCSASGLPEPMYEWTIDDIKKQDGKNLTVYDNGNVTCLAYNFINGVRHTDSYTILITGIVFPDPHDDKIIIIVVVSVCGWIIINLIVSGISFAIYRKHKVIMNAKFPWLKKMVPFANSKDENDDYSCCKKVLWVSLCVVISIFVAVIVYPILFAIAGCPCCRKSHQETRGNRDSRNGSTRDRQSGASLQSMSNSTGAPSQAPPPRPAPVVGPYPNSQAQTNYPHSGNRSMHSPSPVSASGVEYGELRIDAKPGSRKPIELIIQKESAYAELQKS